MSREADRIEGLSRKADTLASNVEDLTKAVASHNRQFFWTRLWTTVLLLLCLAFGWLFYKNYVLRSQVLCPLYEVLVNSYSPNGPSARALGITAYNENYGRIQHQYQALDCGDKDEE